MAEHEPSIGETSEWFTPPAIFTALQLTFDLDPAHPGAGTEHCCVLARRIFTQKDDGLAQPWKGLVFVNMPFGGRNGHVPWLRKFFAHGNSIAIVRAYTSSGWWHAEMPKVEMILFPRGKTKFIRPDGSIGKCPGHGIVLVGMGNVACEALRSCGLGMFWDRTLAEPTPNLTASSIVMSEQCEANHASASRPSPRRGPIRSVAPSPRHRVLLAVLRSHRARARCGPCLCKAPLRLSALLS